MKSVKFSIEVRRGLGMNLGVRSVRSGVVSSFRLMLSVVCRVELMNMISRMRV